MGNTDRAIRLLSERHLRSLLPELLRGRAVEVLAVERTELKLVERQADEVVRALIDGFPTILHVEFQVRHERTLPARVLAYHALLRQRHFPLPVRSLVVYLMHEAPSEPLPRAILPSPADPQLAFHYDLYCPWEQHLTVEDVQRSPALAPFAVLTSGIQTVDLPAVQHILERAPLDPGWRRDLLALGLLLARRRFPDDLLKSWRRQTMTLWEAIKDSPGYTELMEDVRAMGRAEGVRDSIRCYVNARLGSCPEGLDARLAALDPAALEELFEQLVRTVDSTAILSLLK